MDKYTHERVLHKELKVRPYSKGNGKTLIVFKTTYTKWADGYVYAEIRARDRRGKEYFSNNATSGHFVADNGKGKGYHI